MTFVDLLHLTKKFDNGFVAVDDFSLSIRDGEVLVLVGPSGCEKSTVLQMLAGLEKPTSGDVLFNGENVVDVDSQHRDIGMVFQSYALYPHMTVRENLGFGLVLHHVDKHEIARRVNEIAELLDITPILDRKPKQLSGKLIQIGTPKELYDNPANSFVAGFLGSPARNLFDGVLMRDETGSPLLRFGSNRITFESGDLGGEPRLIAAIESGELVQVGIRPEHIEDNRIACASQQKVMSVSVQLVEQLGSEVVAHFVPSTSDKLIASFDARSAVVEGETMDAAITTSRLHFFDKATGISLRSTGLPGLSRVKSTSDVPISAISLLTGV